MRPMRVWARKAARKAAMAGAATSLLALGVAASEGEVDYRKHTMESVGGHMRAIVDIIQQKVSHADHLAIHANALAELATITPALFPEGSAGGDALPAIWEDAEDFKTKLDAFQEAADGFKSAAASGDSARIGTALRPLGQACKGCHDSYRAE